MRLLSILGLALKDGWAARQIFCRKVATDVVANFGNGFLRQRHRVGTHVGNQADGLAADVHPFIERLCGAHGPFGGHAQLAHSLLLQGRRGERCCGITLFCLLFDTHHFGWQFCIVKSCKDGIVFCLTLDAELVEFFSLILEQAGGKCLVILVTIQMHSPVFLAGKGFNFQFAFDDQAQRRALHAPGG